MVECFPGADPRKAVGGELPDQEERFSPPEKEEVVVMVTYEALFQYSLVIIGIIGLFVSIYFHKKK